MPNLTCSYEEPVLTIHLRGRIDSTNADAEEKTIREFRAGYPGCQTVLDASELQYTSSAGLRIFLRLRKEDPSLRIIQVSSEVYEILESTGFTEILKVEKAFRVLSVAGCKEIGSGAKGVVYRYDADTIVKVYRNPESLPMIQRERELARKAFVLGIPTAISFDVVRVGETYGSVFELLDASNYSSRIMEDPDHMEEYVREFTNVLRQIHETVVKKEDFPNFKTGFYRRLKDTALWLRDETNWKLKKMIDEIPEKNILLHGDFHTNNLMYQNGEPILIDMDTLSYGDPIFELANIYITYVGFGVIRPSMVERFIGMPYETACKVWKMFLPMYLQTDDAEKIRTTEEKIKLVSCIRLLHHVVRRETDSEEARKTIAYCQKEIKELAAKYDSLIDWEETK